MDANDDKLSAVEEQNGSEALVAQSDEREERLKSLQAERDALFERLARQQAEFENFRKRALRENADYREFAVAEMAKSLLPVLDNLALAVQNSRPDADPELRKGMELILRQFEAALAKAGVTAIEAKGREFDPRFHEAIEMVPSDEVKEQHVLEELQRGYKIKDRLLRPARVRVATRK